MDHMYTFVLVVMLPYIIIVMYVRHCRDYLLTLLSSSSCIVEKRKCQICRSNCKALCHSSGDICGFDGHISIFNRRSLSQSLSCTFFQLIMIINLILAGYSFSYISISGFVGHPPVAFQTVDEVAWEAGNTVFYLYMVGNSGLPFEFRQYIYLAYFRNISTSCLHIAMSGGRFWTRHGRFSQVCSWKRTHIVFIKTPGAFYSQAQHWCYLSQFCSRSHATRRWLHSTAFARWHSTWPLSVTCSG